MLVTLIFMLMPVLASLVTAGFRIMLLDAIEVSNFTKTQHHIISETLSEKQQKNWHQFDMCYLKPVNNMQITGC